MDASTEINMSNSPLTEDYMPRPRIDSILDKVTTCKLVYVIAGVGYGKTQAVYHYIKQQEDAVVRWIQLTENDNVGSHYWESLSHNISLDNPDLAIRLRDAGFPESSAHFKQFAEILKTSEHRSHKTFLVLDDFHLIHTKQALTFAERCAYLHIPGACVIIISRKEPEINAISLFSKGMASMITENELRFADNEIVDFMKHSGIQLNVNDLPQFIDATKGWALAIKLLSMVLKRTPGNLNHALDIMKQNINKLLEIEAFDNFPKDVQKTVVQLSLLSNLPLTPLNDISIDAPFIQNTPQLASFMWFDSFIGDYRVHPLYLEFLQSKHYVLTYEEKQATYRWAAQWCCDNDFYMDAINYFAKSFQYDRMLEMLLSYPFKLPHDACEYFLNILEKLDPDDKEERIRSILLLKNLFIPLLYLGMGKYEQAQEHSFKIIRKWENSKTPFALYMLYTAYSNLSYINTYTCTVTHKYESAKYLKKALEYFKLSSLLPVKITGPFAVVDVRSFACLVGEGADKMEFDHFLEVTRETATYIAETYHFMYYGYDELVACELAFYRNQPDIARNSAHNALLKAREKKQYSIEMMAQLYLLRIAMQEGNYSLTKEILKLLGGYLNNPDFWNRQLLYDLISGFFFIQIGLPELAPPWLAMDEKESTSEVRIPIRELIVGVKYYIASKKYNQALTILCNSYPREPQERFLFGELSLTLLIAISRIKTGDIEGAVTDFEKAYQLSFNGEFEMFFIELGKDMNPLVGAASKKEGCSIPAQWLKTIGRKATIYAKKTAFIMDSYKEEKHIKNIISLSEREQDILNDLYHGLSRDEIAEYRYLSINTVKKILQSIYIKLGANNNVDAIRMAIEKKLVS